MMRMCEILEMDNIDKGSVIELQNNEDNRIFFLKKGTVKIVTKAGNRVKHVVKKGHVFGELALFDEKAGADEIAIALEDCIVCYIEADKMQEIMQNHSGLKNNVLKIYGLRIKKLERRLNDLLYKDSVTRITEFITDYIDEFGEEENGRMIAKNLLTHKDISNLTNTSRQTVSNVMSKLRKESVIDYDTKYISMLAKP